MNAHIAPPLSNATRTEAIAALLHELRRLSSRLRSTYEALHTDDTDHTAGMRSVLRDLHVGGPQTVPQIARARPVSRQHIQSLVNKLLETGDVELITNPAHKRSRLVQLTPAGRESIQRIHARERALISALELESEAGDVTEAAALIRDLRVALEQRDE